MNNEQALAGAELILTVMPSHVCRIMAGLIGPMTEGIRWDGKVNVDGEKASAGRAGLACSLSANRRGPDRTPGNSANASQRGQWLTSIH